MIKKRTSYKVAGGEFQTKYEAKIGFSLTEFSQHNSIIRHRFASLSIIHEWKVSPAYENATFFDQSKTPIIDPVIPPLELLKKYSKSEDSQNSQNFVCFGDNCSKSFLYEGDWHRKHMNVCNSTIWYCGWCNNGFEYGTYPKVLEHMTRYCKMKPKNNSEEKIVVMKPDFKCEFGNNFGTNKWLLRHKRENCHLIRKDKKKQKKMHYI